MIKAAAIKGGVVDMDNIRYTLYAAIYTCVLYLHKRRRGEVQLGGWRSSLEVDSVDGVDK